MGLRRTLSRWRPAAAPAFNLLVFGLAILALDRVLGGYSLREITGALGSVPPSAIVAALGISAAGYLALIGHDFVAFRMIRHPLPLRDMLVPSFVSFAVSNSAPASVVAAGGVRYRLYRDRGITIEDAAVVAGLNVLTYAVGLCLLAGVTLLIAPRSEAASVFHLPARPLGTLLTAGAGAYLALASFRPGELRLGRLELRVPGLCVALAQLGVSLADWILSSGALYVLLLSLTPLSYTSFLTTFLVAQAAALVVPIPGGVGVLESVVLLLKPPAVEGSHVLAALLLYRVTYYLLPLLLSGALLGGRWLNQARRSGHPYQALRQQLSALSPRLMAWSTFLAGLLLLLGGAVPTSDARLSWLGELLPLGVIEASHFLGSIVGAVLVVVAWALQRRSRTAYHLVRILVGLGILLTLLRSLDLRGAALLGLAWAVVLVAGAHFPREAQTAPDRMGGGWISALGAVVLGGVWTAVLLYRHAELGSQVWWRFALTGQGPRALRATVGATVMILLLAVWRLLSPSAQGAPGDRS